ncbi:MAG: phage tail tape measure protein [Lachnospiraceae bacterium]|nr:phage tail tape measure protein [Lachnospiraceae bacterium]
MGKSNTMQAIISIAGSIDPSLSKSIGDATKQFGGIKGGAKLLGGVAVAGFTAVATGAIAATKALVSLGSEFDAAKDSIRVGTGATGKALDSLYSDAQAVFKNVPTTIEDAGQAIADYNTRLGLSGKPLQNLSQQALEVNKILGEDVSGVIEGSSQAFKQWKISTNNMGNEMDYIFKVSQSTGMGFTTLMEHMQSSGAVLQDLGYGFDEAATFIAQLDKSGINTEQVLKGMKKGLGNVAKEGGDATVAMKDYCKQIKSAKSESEAITIATDVFGAATAVTMAQAVRSGALDIDGMTKALQNNKETINAAASDTYDFAEKWDMLKNNAKAAMEPLASKAFSVLTDTVFPALQQGFEKIQPSMQKIGATLVPLFNQIASVAMPILMQLINAILPYFDISLSGWLTIFKSLGPMIATLVTSLMPAFHTIFVAISQSFQTLQPALQNFIASIIPVIMACMQALVPIINAILSAVSPLIKMITQVIASALPALSAILTALIPVIQFIGGYIGGYLTSVIQTMMPIIQNVINIITSLLDFVTNVFTGNWAAAWTNVKDIFANAFQALGGLIKAPLNAVISIINGAIEGINAVGFDIPQWVPGIGGKKFAVSIPKMPMLASGGFTSGPSIAGEAGTEAVISFNSAYRNENLSYWARAGRMLGINGNVLDILSGKASSTSNNITFAPNITVMGNANTSDIMAELKKEEAEFMDWLDEILNGGGPAYE